MLFLFQSIILWMKLISYAHVNRDMRKLRKQELALREAERGGSNDYANAKPFSSMFAEMKDLQVSARLLTCILFPVYMIFMLNVHG